MYANFSLECQNKTIPGADTTYGQVIPMMMSLCSPCTSSYMAVMTTCMAAQGSFCQQPCSSMYDDALTNCQGAPPMALGDGEPMDLGEALGSLSPLVQACNTGGGGSLPSPGFSNNFPSPGMAGGPKPGCVKIPRAMADRW